MSEQNTSSISFYLRSNRLHVFVSALKELGSPSRICFLLDKDGNRLLILPYDKHDFVSHAVPRKLYLGSSSMEIHSQKLCSVIADKHGWDLSKSYRVPGTVFKDKRAAVYYLAKAVLIDRPEAEELTLG